MRSKAERAARPLRGRSEGLGYVPTSSFHGSRPFGLREKWHLYYKCIACTVYTVKSQDKRIERQEKKEHLSSFYGTRNVDNRMWRRSQTIIDSYNKIIEN